MRFFLLLTVFLAFSVLTACSTVDRLIPFQDKDKDAPLEGERISIMELQKGLEPDNIKLDAEGFVAPEPWANEYWPQAGGYPNHALQNLALSSGELEEVWRADIGTGVKDNLPLTAQPVLFDNVVYTLDTNAQVVATSAAEGQRLWAKDLRPESEDEPVITGGVSYSAGRLYVTSGYNQVFALDPKTGEQIWSFETTSPARAAPTVLDGRVFVVTVDNRLMALNAENGQILWEYQGLNEMAGLVGMASPAANQDIVVPVFSSGELYALRVENGSVAWSENLSPLTRMGGLSSIADIRGLPVLDKGLVIAVSFSGRIVALDERTGGRVWQREIGSAETPWVSGNHIFVLTPNNQMVALGRDTGVIRWVTDLPRFEDEKDRDGAIVLRGPVLAGGRLILGGTGGRVFELNPNTGTIIRNWTVGKTVAVPPIVAGGTLYFLTVDGTLKAYR